MMKRILFTVFTLITLHCTAQQGQWTWMNGDSTANSLGVYGIQGSYAANNTPPALYEACEWTDKQGNFWLFGGVDASNYTWGDLWEFKPALNEWAWIHGHGGEQDSAVYGTIGVPALTNHPGARGWGIVSWVDTTGNLW